MANLRPVHCLNLTEKQQQSFILYFTALPNKPATTVRFFDRSNFYSCHGSDAEFVAKSVFKTTNVVKIMAPPESDIEVPYVVLSKNNFESIVRDLLLVRNYRVEVYKNKAHHKTPNDWFLEFKGSPGNLTQLEDLLFSHKDMVTGSSLISLQMKQEGKMKVIGIACIDNNERVFSVSEFVDNDFYSELEALLVHIGPKECIIPSIEYEYARIKTLLDMNNIVVTTKKRQDFSLEKNDIIQDLNQLLRFPKGQKGNANTMPETSKTIALASLGVAIRYMELMNDSSNYGHYKLKLININRYVHLDAAVVSALNLFPKPGTNMNSSAFKWQSVLGLLDRCRTPQGRRLLTQWITQPLRSYENIKERHDIVECLIENTSLRSELHDTHMKRLPDILIIIKKLFRKKASLQDIFRLYLVVLRMPKVLRLLEIINNKAVRNVIGIPMGSTLEDLKLFKSMVEQIIDLEAAERGEYLIKHTFDDQLREYRKKMDNIDRKMQELLIQVAEELGFEAGKSIKLEFVGNYGFHFRISLKKEVVIRNKNIKILDVAKTGVKFTNTTLAEHNVAFNTYKGYYEEKQKSILDEVLRIAIGYAEPWTMLNSQIAQLDCLLSFSVAAVSAPEPYVRPEMFQEGEGRLKLIQLRHPCSELQEDVKFIANDVVFEKNNTTLYIITGPNMGGKSTFIRSVGVAVLMAHIGSFVPCHKAEITIVDSILGRVGADDNHSKGLSTFMVEMIETAGIIRTASEKSLVIIDELGRGTSTNEGCGIAWSIAEYLAKQTKCFTLFATHFHEIAEMEETLTAVKSCHMSAIASNHSFTLLYQVKPGVMEKSFGIQLAKLAKFPSEVVQLAEKLYEECKDHYTQLQSENDREGMRLLNTAIQKLVEINPNDDESIEKMLNDVKMCIKNSNSSYFRKTFPKIFV